MGWDRVRVGGGGSLNWWWVLLRVVCRVKLLWLLLLGLSLKCWMVLFLFS